MKRTVSVLIALVLCVFAAGTQDHSQTKAQKQQVTGMVNGARYFGFTEPREWTYEVTFDSPRIFYAPYSVNVAGLIASSVTHGFRRVNTRSLTFSIKTLAPHNDESVSVVLDETGKQFWSGSVCEAKLTIVRSGSAMPEGHPWSGKGLDDDGQWKPIQPFPTELMALELHHAPCSKKDNKAMDWVLGEILGMVPADGSSRISRYGWVSAAATEPVIVPAGTYSKVFYSKFPRGDGQYAPRHVVESWVAEGVGLIKYRVTEEGAPVYTLALKSVRKVE